MDCERAIWYVGEMGEGKDNVAAEPMIGSASRSSAGGCMSSAGGSVVTTGVGKDAWVTVGRSSSPPLDGRSRLLESEAFAVEPVVVESPVWLSPPAKVDECVSPSDFMLRLFVVLTPNSSAKPLSSSDSSGMA